MLLHSKKQKLCIALAALLSTQICNSSEANESNFLSTTTVHRFFRPDLYSLHIVRPLESGIPEQSSDGKYISLTHISENKSQISVHEAATNKMLRTFHSQLWPNSLWARQGSRLAVEENGRILIYSPETNSAINLINNRSNNYFENWSWSPDGELIAQHSKELKLWNTHTGELVKSLGEELTISQFGWMSNGELVFGGPNKTHDSGQIAWYDPKLSKIVQTIEIDHNCKFAFSPTFKMLAYSYQSKLHILPTNSLQEECIFEAPSSGKFEISWSPDGRYILAAQMPQGTLTVFDFETKRALGYRTWKDFEDADWTTDGKAIEVLRHKSPPLELRFTPPKAGHTGSPFLGATTGAPRWDRVATLKNLDDCLASLDSKLSNKEKERFKNTPEQELFTYGGGSTYSDALIANVMSKWHMQDLNNYFEKLGIDDPRDITGIVIDSYWRKLHGKPIELEKQVRSRAAWWNSSKSFLHIDRPGSQKLLQFQASDSRTGPFSIGALKEQFKIVGFCEEGYVPDYISLLREARKKFSPSQLAVILFIIPHDWAEEEKHRRHLQHCLYPDYDFSKNPEVIAAKEFQANPDKNIYFMRLSKEKCQEIMAEENEAANMLFSSNRAFLYRGDRLRFIYNLNPDDLLESIGEVINSSSQTHH